MTHSPPLPAAMKPDAPGLVRIIVQLYDRKAGRPVKGNRMRVLQVKNRTVSDVAHDVERALYGVS